MLATAEVYYEDQLIGETTIAFSDDTDNLPPVLGVPANSGDVIQASTDALYYLGADGKRYVFPDQKTYLTWYSDFDNVVTLSDADLAKIPIGGNVTYRPGTKLVKITTDPRVYAVDAHGVLRWITTEEVAIGLYGSDWSSLVLDVPDPFFVNYTVGEHVQHVGDFSPTQVTLEANSINTDKELN